MPSYRVELVTRLGNYTCPYTVTGPDMFEALVGVRRQLEPDGLMIAVQGARRDTYPSGMARIWAAECRSMSCGLDDAPAGKI